MRFRRASDGSIVIERRPLDAAASTAPPEDGSVAIEIADEPFVSGENVRDRLAALVARPGWTLDEVVAWAGIWWRAVLAEVGAGEDGADNYLADEIDGRLLDAIPHNLLIHDGEARFIDLEWIALEPLPLGRLLFRGLIDSLLSMERFATPGEAMDTRVSR